MAFKFKEDDTNVAKNIIVQRKHYKQEKIRRNISISIPFINQFKKRASSFITMISFFIGNLS